MSHYSAKCLISQKLEEASSNDEAIVLVGNPRHAIVVKLVRKDADGVAVKENLGDNVFCEFGVSLNGNVLARRVHGLYRAVIVAAERYGVGGEVGDNVGMHLVDSHFLQAKNFLAFGRQVNSGDGYFPALGVAADLASQSAAQDLVAKADANDAHAVRRERRLCVLDQLQDPRVIVKGVVARPGNQNRIDVVEGRVGVQVVDDAVAGNGQLVRELLGRRRDVAGALEELCEDGRVVADARAGLRLRRVGLEHG